MAASIITSVKGDVTYDGIPDTVADSSAELFGQGNFGVVDLTRGPGDDVFFAATGVTDGNLLSGVKFGKAGIMTDTVVMRASTRTVRWVKTQHTDIKKFED